MYPGYIEGDGEGSQSPVSRSPDLDASLEKGKDRGTAGFVTDWIFTMKHIEGENRLGYSRLVLSTNRNT